MENKVKDVFVTLVSSAHAEDGAQEAPIRLRCRGQIKESPNGFLLKYQEVQQEDPKAAPNVQDVMLTVQTGSVPRVTMNRMGDYGTTMVFVKDRRFEGAYHTPYGDLGLALYAMQVQCKLGEDYGSIHLEYQLDMQGSYSAVQCIDVSFCAESSQPC